MRASRQAFRRRLLAGASVLALTLGAVPALACTTVSSNTTISASTGCVNWSGGNLSVTNTGAISTSGFSAVTVAGASVGTLTLRGSISAGNTGIANYGSMAALINSGSISGGSVGISSGGTIGTVTNSGTISGADVGILNIGTIGTLSNSGSISDGGFDNGGSIGAMSNTGTINGGAWTGLYNNANSTIGTLSNNGTISGGGGNAGLINYGSIGALTNGGAVSGAGGMINNAGGTIGMLSNSGTISGSSNAGLLNGGSIGTLTNSGTISGNIGVANSGSINALGNNGTISGSTQAGILNTGATIGTLTNSGTVSGGAGTGIVNTGASIGTLSNSGAIRGNIGIANSGSIGALEGSIGGSISGRTNGIANTGSIGALTNSGAISGGLRYGIYDAGGVIGALTNAGTISGGATGIASSSSGRIGTLTNTGVISGNRGIFNAGSIGALGNSGVIEAPTAIFNATTGTLGPIVNGGLIAGNIVNLSSRTLTIGGGSGTLFGTLTGASGAIGGAAQGTITSTASNLAFAAGNLLLNDAINVGNNMVVNGGATIKVVNGVSITGAYQQSGGGLVAQASSASSYGYLDVSRNATLANAAIVITGSGLVGGSSITIVRAGGTGNYAGNTASIIGTSGLTATLETSGNDLVVSLAGASSGASNFTAIGLAAGGVAAQLGPVLDRINGDSSASAVAFQNAVLVPLVLLPRSLQGQAMKQLAPAYNTSQLVLNSAPMVQETVEQHQQTTMRYDPKTGAAASLDTGDSALWAHLLGNGARHDSHAGFDGYHSSDAGLIAGVDHLFTPELLGGVAAIGLRGSLGGIDNASGQSARMDSYGLTFYGTYRHGRAFIDAQLGAGWNQFGQHRGIAFLGETASASFDGQQYLAHALAGYDFPVGGMGGMVMTPLVGLSWLHARSGPYGETGAGAADLSVQGQALDGLTQEVGVKAAWSFETEFGQLVPQVTGKWVHDYTHGPIASGGVIGGEAFAVTVPRIAADGARIDAAATLKRGDRLSFGVEYNGELRAGYRSHTGLTRARWQF
jgi:uncharacterized protein with beta-barrel porin domain